MNEMFPRSEEMEGISLKRALCIASDDVAEVQTRVSNASSCLRGLGALVRDSIGNMDALAFAAVCEGMCSAVTELLDGALEVCDRMELSKKSA